MSHETAKLYFKDEDAKEQRKRELVEAEVRDAVRKIKEGIEAIIDIKLKARR